MNASKIVSVKDIKDSLESGNTCVIFTNTGHTYVMNRVQSMQFDFTILEGNLKGFRNISKIN